MPLRTPNLESIGEVLATFNIHQTAGSDDLTDADVGKAVTLTGDDEVGPGTDGDILLGKLIGISLEDGRDGARVATVQIAGVCRLAMDTPNPAVGNRVVCGDAGTVKQAPALADNDPAGGNIARGTVLAVNGTADCVILLN